MNFWSMSASGGIFILAIVIIRSLFQGKLSRKVFQVLWFAAVLRLLLPFSIPSVFSIYSLAVDYLPISENSAEEMNRLDQTAVTEQDYSLELHSTVFSIWPYLYWAGVGICGLYYLFTYVRCLREFQTSLPVEKKELQEQIDVLSGRRKITVRQWDLGAAPLTYGIFHPVILLPKTLMQEDREQINFVLIHEYMHIRCLDALKKIVLVVVCCVHWFNPLVWLMNMLANRDIELSCDQNVVKYFGKERRSAYALTLIHMEEKKDVRINWGNSFSKNVMEERIVAIMKGKKDSIIIGVLSGVLSAGLVLVFTTSAISARSRWGDYEYTTVDEAAESGINHQNQAAYASEMADASETTENGEWFAQQTATYDSSYDSSSSTGIAKEQVKGSAISVPPEYAAFGITADDRTGGWQYDDREVAVFYDQGKYLMTNQVSTKNPVYLEVRRDSKDRIKKIQELDKKQMQKLLEDTGLVME